MEEGRCGWYGIDDAICMERSAAARLRYGIPFKRVSRCFSEHWNVLLVLQNASHDSSQVSTFARGTVRPLRPPPLPNASLATLLTITLLPVSNLAEATRTNYMHLVVLYSIYPQYGTLLAIVVMVSVKFLPSAEPLER